MRPSDLPPGCSHADIDAAAGVRPPAAERAWADRIAAIAKSIGVKLDPNAVAEETTLDVGTIPAYEAFRLAVSGRVTVSDTYLMAGSRYVHIEIDCADDDEPVRAVVVFP